MIEWQPEFSRPVLVDQVSSRGMEMTVEADAAECAALAARFNLRAVERLSARVKLKAAAGGTLFRVHGELSAQVVQTCVVTLEPLPVTIDAAFDLTYGGDEPEDGGGELELSFDDADPPEPLVGGSIDIGEAVAEHLALELEPFPRKAGAEFNEPADRPVVDDEKPHPFAVLARLQQKKG